MWGDTGIREGGSTIPEQAEEHHDEHAPTRTALDNPLSPNALEELRLPVRAKLAAAWTSFMFLYIYVDYLALYKPGMLDDILVGKVHEFEAGPTFVALALTSVSVPALMVLLSTILPARATRTVNLVVATLYIPFSVYNAAGESWSYSYFYGFSIGLEVLILAFVLRAAWTWPRLAASPATSAAGFDSEPLRARQQV